MLGRQFLAAAVTIACALTVGPVAAAGDGGEAKQGSSAHTYDGLIAFNAGHYDADLWTVRPDAGDLRRITHTPDRIEVQPDWSPDGRQLAFTSGPCCDELSVVVGSLTGQVVQSLTSPGNHGFASWSPDGRQLAFHGKRDGVDAWDIYLINKDGSRLRQLTDGAGQVNWEPAWSPRGDRIAFMSDRTGDLELFTIRVDGSGLRRLTHSTGDDSLADWSPDGRFIAFQSWRSGSGDVYVMRSDGSKQRRLRSSSEHFDGMPTWSPDGKSIAFVSERDGGRDLYVARVRGKIAHRVTDIGTNVAWPDWSP